MNAIHSTNGITAVMQSIHQLAFSLPHSPDRTIYLHLTNLPQTLLLFFSSNVTGAPTTSVSLGSLVYALPNRNTSANLSSQPLSTPLYSRTSSVDFATRVSRILARRTDKPVYVGGEIRFWEIEEESEALRAVIDVVGKVLSEGVRANEDNGT